MDIVSVVKFSGAIKKFAEQDLISLLASYDLMAAHNSLKNLSSAKDSRMIFWSTLNHLESAESKYESELIGYNRFQSAQSLIYIVAIRTSILKYLDEPDLIDRCFDYTMEICKKQNDYAWSRQGRDLISSWNPANWFGLARYINSEFGRAARSFDMKEFWRVLGYEEAANLFLDTGPEIDPR
jgi:hypothetical protein